MTILYFMKSPEKYITTRYPLDLYTAIKQRAAESGRSFNAEVVYELQHSRQPGGSQPEHPARISEDDLDKPELTIEQAWKRYSVTE